MDPAFSSPFFRKRALYLFLVAAPVLAVCQHFGHGVLGLPLMALAFWPFPFRCRVDDSGISISWLVTSEPWNWDDIRALKLEEDQRWGVVGRRGNVLAIERRSGARAILRGKPEVLSDLASEIARRIAAVR